MTSETAQGKTYSTSVLMNTLGISRGTLRYYEQIGILSPSRTPGSNYRTYSNSDVFCVVKSILLKSSGMQLQRAKGLLDDGRLEPEGFVDTCLDQAKIQHRRDEAVLERLQALRHAVTCGGNDLPRLVRAPEWLIFHDGAEEGYDNFEPNKIQDSLMGNMPISSFAAVMDVDVFDPGEERRTRWGRTVMTTYADLIPELADNRHSAAHLGGCPCLTLTYVADQDKIPGFDPSGSVCARLASFLRAHDLKPAGSPFAPDVLPVGDKVYCNLYLPVEAKGIRGRMVVAKGVAAAL